MATTETYPGIAKACMEIALDNGGINIVRPLEQWRVEVNDWLTKQEERDTYELKGIDIWLTKATPEELSAICTGSEDTGADLLKNAPLGTDDLLNDYFDEVC